MTVTFEVNIDTICLYIISNKRLTTSPKKWTNYFYNLPNARNFFLKVKRIFSSLEGDEIEALQSNR